MATTADTDAPGSGRERPMDTDERPYDGENDLGTPFGIDLKTIVNAVRRNLTWIAVIVGGVIAAGLLITLLMTPRYIGTSRVLVEQEADEIIEGSDLRQAADSWDSERFLQTQVDIVRSRSLAERIVQSAELHEDADFFVAMGSEMPSEENEGISGDALTELRIDEAIELLQEHLHVHLPNDSRIITIAIETTSAEFSARLANLYAENFIQNNLNRKFDSSSYARQFLADQLEEARARLEVSERDLNQYSRAAGLIRVQGRGENGNQETTLSVTNDTLIQLNNAASEASADRVAAQDRWETIAREPVLSIPQVISNQAVQDLLRQKAEIEANLAEELSRHLGGHPTVKALRAQIEELDRRIESIGRSIKRSVYLEYEAAREKEGSLRDRVSGLRSDALDEQDRGVQFNVLKRVADTNRALYDALLERYNALNATAGAASNNLTLVDRANVPRLPASPSLPLNLVLALLAGLVLAGVFVFLRETFDDTIRAPDDVETKLGLPLMGLIPLDESQQAMTAIQDSKSSLSEAYGSLVTNLRYSTPGGFPKVIAVTSAGQGEGKSTTAFAISTNLARIGKNVLLIDADLRRPTLHNTIGDGKRGGLTDVLVGQASLAEVLVPSDQPNLTYMTALPIPPDPSVLLAGDQLERIIDEAASRFDVVVLDAPPLLGLSDAASIATLVDGVLFLVDASSFHRGAIKSALRRLALVKANVLGVVLSKFDPKAGGNEYSYYGTAYYTYGTERSGSA